jgi:hypothetical protein
MEVFMRLGFGVAYAILLFSLAGCGGTGQVAVEGTVTYDGQPVEEGSIAFIATTKEGKGGGGTILQGKYTLGEKERPMPGNYKVQIRWSKPTGKKYKSETGEMLDVREEALPPKYNDATTLTADLTSGTNKVDFNLTK